MRQRKQAVLGVIEIFLFFAQFAFVLTLNTFFKLTFRKLI